MRLSLAQLKQANPCVQPYPARWPGGSEDVELAWLLSPEGIETRHEHLTRSPPPDRGRKSIEQLTREHTEWCAFALMPEDLIRVGMRHAIARATARALEWIDFAAFEWRGSNVAGPLTPSEEARAIETLDKALCAYVRHVPADVPEYDIVLNLAAASDHARFVHRGVARSAERAGLHLRQADFHWRDYIECFHELAQQL